MKLNEIYAYQVANMLANNVSVSKIISDTVSSIRKNYCNPINKISESSLNFNTFFLESLKDLPENVAITKLQNKVNTFIRSVIKHRGY